jgi:hypothetical protein
MAKSTVRRQVAAGEPVRRGLAGPAHLALAGSLARAGRLEEAIGLYDAAASYQDALRLNLDRGDELTKRDSKEAQIRFNADF